MADTITAALAASGVQPRTNLHVEMLTGRVGMGLAGVPSNSLSDGDTWKLCKIPNGAHILDGWVDFGTTDGAVEINIGLTGDEDAIIASASASDTFHRFTDPATAVLPLKVSVTDNARDQFKFLTVTVGAGASSPSVSGTIAFMVQYTMDLTV